MLKLYWQDEAKTILVRELDRTWTWEDYHKNVADAQALLNESKHPIIIIVDARKIRTRDVPKDALMQASQSRLNLPENLIAQIVISESRWIEGLVKIYKHVMPKETEKLHLVRTMEKAQKLIEKLSKKKRRRRMKMQL